MNNIYLYGASGHGKVVLEIAEDLGVTIEAFIDTNEELSTVLGYPVLHSINSEIQNLVVSIGDNRIREKISKELYKFNYPLLIHSSASISRRTVIGKGTVVMAGVTINSEVLIGKHCIVNTNSSIDHECIVGDYVHLSPNTTLAGNVKVKDGVHLGINSCVIPGVTIGKWAVIGAGTVVIKDVPDYAVVVGNPGKIIKYNLELK